MRAVFDSLALNFSFQKTPLVQKVLENIFDELQMQQVIGPLKGFKNLNLSIKFASASEMDKYEKLCVLWKVDRKIETNFFTPIKGEFNDEVSFLVIVDKVHILQSDIFIHRESNRPGYRNIARGSFRRARQGTVNMT